MLFDLKREVQDVFKRNVLLDSDLKKAQEEILKLTKLLEEEKDKNKKEVVKKQNKTIAATKKWLNAYPEE